MLTQRDLNRAVLARQMLLERARDEIPRALERMGGLQAQYAPSMYIGLWSRLEGFERNRLDLALERREVVQGTLMRATIHLVSASDYWPIAIAVRRARREQWLRSGRRELTAQQMAAAARRLRRRVADGRVRRAEIDALLGGGSVVTNGVNLWLDLVRAPPSGTWDRRRADVYAAAAQWLGPPPKLGERDGLELLVRRYLGGFGPAPAEDIANWSGVPAARIAPVLARMKLRRLRADGGRELVDLPRAALPDPQTPAPVRFLPIWDATLLVHARRTGILPEAHRPKVFSTRTPQSVATFLVDGQVAGTWRHDRGRVAIEPFTRLDAATRRELRHESERLVALHAERT